MHEIARYQREIPVSLERMYENALDWEHLPHLHASSFSDAELLAHGDTFWEARLRLRGYGGLTQVVRLTLDEERRTWISAVRSGVSRGLEIHTTATATATGARQLTVDVRFLVPGWRPWNAALGRQLVRTYRTLYDEDEQMMRERQRRLDRPRLSDSPACLGSRADVLAPGFTFTAKGRPFRVADIDGQLIAFSRTCPHMLGPLDGPIEAGHTTCPWHGYRFDLRTRACSGHPHRLSPAPALAVDASGMVWVTSPSEDAPLAG